jgi:hypothetical protein
MTKLLRETIKKIKRTTTVLEVRPTGSSHFRITTPKGTTVMSSSPGNPEAAMKKTVRALT